MDNNITFTQLKSGERIDEVNEKIRLIQKKDGLTFGTDAYMLAAFVTPAPRSRAADLGSGSGIVSLLCAAKEKLCHIYAIEIQPEFADIGRRNIAENGFENRITQLCADIRDIRPEATGGELDAVLANPPYLCAGHGKRCAHDMRSIARHEENGTIYDFCAAASRLLKFGGKFYTVFRPDRLSDLMAALRAHRLEPKRMTFVHPDTSSPPSMVLVESRLGGAPSLNLTPPLILYRDGPELEPRVYTDRAAEVYNTCML